MPILLTTVIGIIIIGSSIASYVQGKDKKKIKEFLREENKTYIKSKDELNKIHFVEINFNDIKFKPKSVKAKEDVKALLSYQNLKLANFKDVSNSELKKTFGSNNFKEVLEYQNNYDDMFKQLRITTESLIKDNDDKSAISLLNYSINMGSDVTKDYTMLADLYAKNKMRMEMFELIDNVRTNKNLSQQKIMNHIKELETKNN
ncbi:MAG: hypothetical protein MJ244_02475 [Clostridia bacterium]|nr:hypothetical protein [Clostridia bacterium]